MEAAPLLNSIPVIVAADAIPNPPNSTIADTKSIASAAGGSIFLINFMSIYFTVNERPSNQLGCSQVYHVLLGVKFVRWIRQDYLAYPLFCYSVFTPNFLESITVFS